MLTVRRKGKPINVYGVAYTYTGGVKSYGILVDCDNERYCTKGFNHALESMNWTPEYLSPEIDPDEDPLVGKTWKRFVEYDYSINPMDYIVSNEANIKLLKKEEYII